MNATELLAELRPGLEASPADDAILERVLLAGPEPSPSPSRRRYTRPLAVAGAIAVAATAAVALFSSGCNGPVGLAGAAAALTQPDVLLHFKVTTTHYRAARPRRPRPGRPPTAAASARSTAKASRSPTTSVPASRDLRAERNEVVVQTDPEPSRTSRTRSARSRTPRRARPPPATSPGS